MTAMHGENPAIGTYRDLANTRVYCLPTTETAAGMTDALKAMAKFVLRLASTRRDRTGATGRLYRTRYSPPGKNRSYRRRPCHRYVAKKINGEPFTTEVPMETWDEIAPAPPLDHLKDRNIAVVTTSGVVPWGNPDRFKTYRNTHWRKYNIAELKELEPGKWEAVHGGYNVAYMNKNPHYGVPLDALRSFEAEGVIGAGKLYPAYYVIPGNQGSPAVMRRIGQEIAADLKKDNVEGVLFVAT